MATLKVGSRLRRNESSRQCGRAPLHDYNFVRIHETLRVTPAMAASVTDKLSEIADIVALIEAKAAEKPMVRGPYKKRT